MLQLSFAGLDSSTPVEDLELLKSYEFGNSHSLFGVMINYRQVEYKSWGA